MTDVGTTPRKGMSPMQRLQIFEKHNGICCLCERKIQAGEKWIVEHPRALGLGGADTDENKRPAHESCRRVKDKADVTAIAKAKRMKARHLGIKKPSGFRKPPPGYKYSWKSGRMEKVAP